jgi:2-oxoglutarate ferredoxin oxidoreductase subunit beta
VLEAINPIQTTLGISNVSFVAQTVDWNPAHLLATLTAAHRHKGFSFVRVVQRCPHYKAGMFESLQSDPSGLLLLTHPDGIDVDDAIKKVLKNQCEHDPSNLNRARELAGSEDAVPIGLLYRNEKADHYEDYTSEGIATSRSEKLAALDAQLDRYQV